MTATLRGRPPVARIAVTEPPRDWFGGVSHAFFRRYRRALADLGVELFDVPVDAFVPFVDEARCADLIDDLRAFRPGLALGLPLGSHALVCRLAPDDDGFRPNIFTDILDIPTICIWDHAPLELAEQLLLPHPATPEQSRLGAAADLRRALAHPRMIPWSRDSGQSDLMRQFGFLPRSPLCEISPSFPDMTAAPSAGHDHGVTDVAFVGTLYPERAVDRHPVLADLATGAIARWLEHGGACWDHLAAAIAGLSADMRSALALEPEQSFFWAFVHRVIVHEAQTARRRQVLGSINQPIAFYGRPYPGLAGSLRPAGTVTFGPDLAAVYARHPILVDVQSAGFIHGFSHKPIHAFAAGGFVLTDRKDDFVAAFGEAGAAVSYASTDELAGKIDRFLSAPRYRREVGDALRAEIAARHGLHDVLTRVLQQAAALTTSRRLSTPPARPTTGTNLLPQLRRYDGLSRLKRTKEGLTITTPPGKWTYAAAVDIPPAHAARLEATVIVETGRVDIGLLADDKSRLTRERVIGPGRRPVSVPLKLPDNRANTVVIRNTHDGPSRLRVVALALHQLPA